MTKILVFQRSQQPVDSNMTMKMYTLCGFLDVARQFQHLQLRWCIFLKISNVDRICSCYFITQCTLCSGIFCSSVFGIQKYVNNIQHISKILSHPDISADIEWIRHVQTPLPACHWNVFGLAKDGERTGFCDVLATIAWRKT